MKAGEHIVAQQTGQAGKQDDHAVDYGSLFPVPAQSVHAEGHEVFKHRNDGRKAGKGHKQEEEAPPNSSPGHIDEHIGQGDEDQAGSRVYLYTIAEASGEDDEASHQGYEGIQGADPGPLSGKGVVLAHIAAEDLHGGHTQAQGEEGLIHGGGNHVPQAYGLDILPIGHQIKPHAGTGTGERQAVDSQDNNEDQEAGHHEFTDVFQPLLQASAADQEAQNHGQRHPEGHLSGRGQQI